MKFSFLEDTSRIRSVVTDGAWTDDAAQRPATRHRRKSSVCDLFFSTRPIHDEVLMRELHTQLIPSALASCSARSPQLTVILRELIRLVMSTSSESSTPTLWNKALYVVLRTSLVKDHRLLVPRLYLSPNTIRVAEAMGAVYHSAQMWSCELDPVLSALVNVNGMASSSVAIVQQHGKRGFADSVSTDVSTPCSSVGYDSCGSWTIEVSDPVREEEILMKLYENNHSSSPLAHELCGHSRQHEDSSHHTVDSALLASNLLRSGVEYFRFRVDDAQQRTGRDVGMFIAAAHFVLSGSPDPFGVVVHSRTETIGGTSLPQLVVHPALISAPPNFQHHSAARFGVRGFVSLLESAAEWGNICCALRAIVKRSDAHDVMTAIGAIGVAAVKGLHVVLQYITRQVARSQTTVASRMAAITTQEVLRVWLDHLVPVTEVLATLADVFAVAIHDKSWSSSKSLNQCGSTQFLSRLYTIVARQHPAHHSVASLAQWNKRGMRGSGDSGASASEAPSSGKDASVDSMGLIAYLFSCGVVPFCAMLQRWLATGEITDWDPFDEFFVVPSYGDTLCGYRVVVDRLPVFVSLSTAQKMLTAGVARSVLLDSLKYVRKSVARSSATQETIVFAWAQGQWAEQFNEAFERIISGSKLPPAFLAETESASDGVAKWQAYFQYSVEPLIDELNWIGSRSPIHGVSQQNRGSTLEPELDDSKQEYMSEAEYSSSSSVDVLAPSSTSDSQKSHEQPSNKARTSLSQCDSTVESSRFFSPADEVSSDVKRQAAAILEAEYAAKMKILRFQESMIRWRARRIGLKVKRAVALRDEVPFMKDMYASHPSRGEDRDRLTPVGIFVVPLKDAFPQHSQSESADEEGPTSPVPSDCVIAEEDQISPQMLQKEVEDGFLDQSSDVLEEESANHTFEHVAVDEIQASDEVGPQYAEVADQSTPSTDNPGRFKGIFAPIALTDEEYLELQCVGITSQHYHLLRLRHAAEVYEEREARLQEMQNEFLDLEHYLSVVCADGCRTSLFVESSEWAQTITNDTKWQAELRGEAALESTEGSAKRFEHLVDNLLAYKSYLCDLGTTAVAAVVPRTLYFLLSPTFGVAARLATCLRNVCLLQGPSEVTTEFLEWDTLVFHTDNNSSHRSQLRFIFEAMREGFQRMWNTSWSGSKRHLSGPTTGLPAKCPLALQLSISDAGLDHCQARPTATPFDLLPLISISLGEQNVENDIPSESLDEYLLLMPPHAVKRYSDLFVSLIFWRWSQRALDVCWMYGVASRTARHHHREIWLFCTLARGVIGAVVEHVWYGVSHSCKLFDALCADRVAIAGMPDLDSFISQHDSFLVSAYEAALLGPQYSRARQQIRVMVQLVERVFHFLHTAPATSNRNTTESSHLENVQRKQLLQHAREFWSAASMFVDHLSEVVEGHDRNAATKALTDMIARIAAALTSCRIS